MICLHHNDLDGRAAAAIVCQATKHSVACIEMDYRKHLPEQEIGWDEEVYIVDFSLQIPGDWEKLLARTQNVIWIDHHETAIKKRPDLDNTLAGIRNTESCGAKLTWEWFNRHDSSPYVITLVDLWDRWKHDDCDEVLDFVAGMKVRDQSPESETWDLLLSDYGVSEIQDDGKVIRLYETKDNNENLSQFAHELQFEGFSCLALNSIRRSSLVFGANLSKYDLCIAYVFDGAKWTVSLYSERIKVNDIAIKHGGGGHPGAAGFICEKLPWFPDKEDTL
jgi:uncharacterized protein